MKKKILITGYNGFIGSHLINAIDLSKYSIIGFSNKPDKQVYNNIKCFNIDISNWDAINSLNIDTDINVIIHLAAIKNAQCPENILNNTNVKGTENICRLAEKYKTEKIVFISSVAVYSNSLSGIINETSPTSPDNNYGISKLKAEKIIKNRCENWTILRPTNVFGEGCKTYYQYFKSFEQGLKKWIMFYKNSPSHFLYVKDLVNVILKSFEESLSSKKVFIVADNEKKFINKKIIEIVNNYKKKNKILIKNIFCKKFDKRIFSEEKIINELGIEYYFGVEQGINNYFDFYNL
jgi:nucleoside-diphosphate-sugar epimerase